MLATQESVNQLAQKESARLLVVSDCHGYIQNLRKIVETHGKTCDALCFLGDGMEDLLELAEEDSHLPPEQKILPPVIAFVRGNGDSDHYLYFQKELTTIHVPVQTTLSAAGKTIFMSHGHTYGVYYSTDSLLEYSKECGFDAALFGHTHVPFNETKDGILLLNPGSCALPRSNSSKSFAILTVSRNSPETDCQFYSLS